MIKYTSPIVVLAGTTASGKSNTAIQLAKDINGYIINGDSRQIYKEINIGSAKPIPDTISNDGTYVIDGINHYLYDYVPLNKQYTLYEYQKDVQKILDRNKNKIPIIVGGTGLYIDSIVHNYDLKENTNSQDYSKYTIEELQNILGNRIEELNQSDRLNKHRLIRLIQRNNIGKKKGEPLKYIYFVLDKDIDVLKDRIKERIEYMFNNGLEEENIYLIQKGYTYDMKGLKSIGYQEFKEYFNKYINKEELKEKIYLHTIQYAKRQRTWFRRNKDSIWTDKYDEILEKTKTFLKQYYH